MQAQYKDGPESEVNKLLDRVEEETELNTDVFDEIKVDNLPPNVPAMTSNQKLPYNKVTLYADPTLLKRSWPEQGLTLTHEAVHANEMKYQLGSALSDKMNDNQRKFFMGKMNQSQDQIEASTELLARTLFQDSKYAERKGYPYLTEQAKQEAEDKGLDIEHLLEEDMNEPVEIEHQNSAYELADEISEYFDELEDLGYLNGGDLPYNSDSGDISEYLETVEDYEDAESDLDYIDSNYGEIEYGKGANLAGNVNQLGRVPLSSSIGTPTQNQEIPLEHAAEFAGEE
jgi:hypothetical protein